MVDSDGNNTNRAYYEIPGNATQYLMYNGTQLSLELNVCADDQTASCLMLDNYDSTKDAKVSVNYTYYNASDSGVARAQSLTGNTASSTYTSISYVYTIVAAPDNKVKLAPGYSWGQCADQAYGFTRPHFMAEGARISVFLVPQQIYRQYHDKPFNKTDQQYLAKYNFTDCQFISYGNKTRCWKNASEMVRTNMTAIPCFLLLNTASNTTTIDYQVDYIKSSEDDADDPNYPNTIVDHDTRMAGMASSGDRIASSFGIILCSYTVMIASI
ncbi:hypothetical protein BDF22DRAFT_739309 [Syncephalis plumigaleata]|nr:hypothetical protein BDF22DRAFT_739309 [Syncephalis plumigaleata]